MRFFFSWNITPSSRSLIYLFIYMALFFTCKSCMKSQQDMLWQNTVCTLMNQPPFVRQLGKLSCSSVIHSSDECQEKKDTWIKGDEEKLTCYTNGWRDKGASAEMMRASAEFNPGRKFKSPASLHLLFLCFSPLSLYQFSIFFLHFFIFAFSTYLHIF